MIGSNEKGVDHETRAKRVAGTIVILGGRGGAVVDVREGDGDAVVAFTCT